LQGRQQRQREQCQDKTDGLHEGCSGFKGRTCEISISTPRSEQVQVAYEGFATPSRQPV
jgi:hypothetical protein